MPFLKKEKPQGVVLVFVVDTRGVDFCFSCHKFQVSRGGKTNKQRCQCTIHVAFFQLVRNQILYFRHYKNTHGKQSNN